MTEREKKTQESIGRVCVMRKWENEWTLISFQQLRMFSTNDGQWCFRLETTFNKQFAQRTLNAVEWRIQRCFLYSTSHIRFDISGQCAEFCTSAVRLTNKECYLESSAFVNTKRLEPLLHRYSLIKDLLWIAAFGLLVAYIKVIKHLMRIWIISNYFWMPF